MRISDATGAGRRFAPLLAVALLLGTSRTAMSAPQLLLEKAHGYTPYVSSYALYRIAVVNLGNAPSVGTITVTDTLPTGLDFYDGTGNQGWTIAANGSIVTAHFAGSISPGDSSAFLIDTYVEPAAYPEVTNWASMQGGGDANPNDNRAGDRMPVSGPADITISKTHGGDFTVTSTGTFYFSAQNNGPLATIGTITVRDTLPAGLTFAGASGSEWTIAHAGQIVTANHSTPIPGGLSSAFALSVAVSQDAFPMVTNAATISVWADIDSTNNRSTDVVTVVQPTPAFAIDKRHVQSSFIAGQAGVYAIKVRNLGLVPTTGAYTVTDTLAPSLTFADASGSGWSFAVSGQIVVATRTVTLAVGDSSEFSMTVAVSPTAPSFVTNGAAVRGGGASRSGYDVDYVPVDAGTAEVGGSPPAEITLQPPAPDPMGAQGALIRYALPRGLRTSLAIYDAAGRRVRSLVDGPVPAGEHRVRWNARDDAGLRLAPGVYFVRLQADRVTRTRPVAVLF